MLKKRIIGVLPVKGTLLVRSVQYSNHFPIGKPEIAAKYLCDWGIDEIILVDIDASSRQETIDFELVSRVAKEIQVPLTVGGGVKTKNDVKNLLSFGADKISINSGLTSQMNNIEEMVELFGSQCILGCIDIIRKKSSIFLYNHVDSSKYEINLEKYSIDLQKRGIGEIMVNLVEHDGMKNGYDCDLLKNIKSYLQIPVIGFGGANNQNDIIDLFNYTDISAAAVGNYFHFSEHSVSILKSHLSTTAIPIRSDIDNSKYLDNTPRL